MSVAFLKTHFLQQIPVFTWPFFQRQNVKATFKTVSLTWCGDFKLLFCFANNEYTSHTMTSKYVEQCRSVLNKDHFLSKTTYF